MVPKFTLAGETASCAGGVPEPVTALVLLPPLLVKVTLLLKLPVLVGVKLTSTLLLAKPGRVNGLPETIENGGLTATVPLVMAMPPRLVMTKVVCTVLLTATIPKLKLTGETASCAGGVPEPVTPLVELPPLHVKMTLLLKLPMLVGMKLITTLLLPKPARLNGLPETMENGGLTATVPLVMAMPPRLVMA